MKSFIFGLALLLGISSASANDRRDPQVLASSHVPLNATLSVPPDVVLRHIFRIYRPSTNTRVTHYYWPDRWEDIGYEVEGTIGFISATPFENSVLIRQCVGPHSWNNFTSPDPNCEPASGGVVLPGDNNIGYISTVHLPGTTPLYRCVFEWRRKIRHFDSLDLNCEGVDGVRNDGTLGYVFQ